MMMLRAACLMLAVLASFDVVRAQAPDPKGVEFFEQKIRPVLAQHCYSCHSAEAHARKKLQGRLSLDSQEAMLNGGESGPAIVKGKASESRLVKALKYDGLEMPSTALTRSRSRDCRPIRNDHGC